MRYSEWVDNTGATCSACRKWMKQLTSPAASCTGHSVSSTRTCRPRRVQWLTGTALPSQGKMRALSLWLDVSAHWLRFGEEAGAGRGTSALRQNAAAYRVDSNWLAKKYDALNEPHKRMVVELLLALLRLEGKKG
jgi:hypothetical protein